MFQHLQNLLYFCLKKLNILVRISKGVSESHKLVFCLCSKGPQINCTQFPEVDHCLRNLPGQAKSTRYFQDLMVMRWEDDFLEIFCSEHPITYKKFVESKQRKASNRRKVNSSRDGAANSEYVQWALAQASRDSWYTPLTFHLVHRRGSHRATMLLALILLHLTIPRHRKQFKRQQRKNKNVVLRHVRCLKTYFLYVHQAYQLFTLFISEL